MLVLCKQVADDQADTNPSDYGYGDKCVEFLAAGNE
jgi:hypothetical protein